jgi:hypothetical protein
MTRKRSILFNPVLGPVVDSFRVEYRGIAREKRRRGWAIARTV